MFVPYRKDSVGCCRAHQRRIRYAEKHGKGKAPATSKRVRRATSSAIGAGNGASSFAEWVRLMEALDAATDELNAFQEKHPEVQARAKELLERIAS